MRPSRQSNPVARRHSSVDVTADTARPDAYTAIIAAHRAGALISDIEDMFGVWSTRASIAIAEAAGEIEPRVRRKKSDGVSEHNEQVGLMNLCDSHRTMCRVLRLIFSVPNGLFIPGHEDLARAIGKKMVDEGLKAGVPDLMLPVARQGYHGLFVEMKTLTGYAKQDQKRWHEDLRAEGYRVEVCRGRDAAWTVIQDYLGVQLEDPAGKHLKGAV